MTRTSATRPEARLASHQPWVWSASAVPRRSSRAPAGGGSAARTRERPDQLDPAAVVDQEAAALGAGPARPPSGPESSAALESVSASSAVSPSAVAPTSPVQAGSPRRRVEQVVGEAAVGVAPDPHVDARGRDPAGAEPQHVGALAGERVFDEDLVGVDQGVGAADPDVAAAVDDEARVAAQATRATMSAARPLPMPPVSKRRPGGRTTPPPRRRPRSRASGGRGGDAPDAGPERRRQGELLGAITLEKAKNEAVPAAEDMLLTDLASQAGLVLRNVRLTAELQATIDDLRASRRRLVQAQDDERQRIERNLHDGAQQQLVAMACSSASWTELPTTRTRSRN